MCLDTSLFKTSIYLLISEGEADVALVPLYFLQILIRGAVIMLE